MASPFPGMNPYLYDWRLDYRQPVPDPPLRAQMAAWLEPHLSERRQEK